MIAIVILVAVFPPKAKGGERDRPFAFWCQDKREYRGLPGGYIREKAGFAGGGRAQGEIRQMAEGHKNAPRKVRFIMVIPVMRGSFGAPVALRCYSTGTGKHTLVPARLINPVAPFH